MIRMPHFYFHARGPGRFMPDYMGDDLPDAEWARRLALQAIRDILSDPLDSTDYSRWILEVADESGRPVATIPFRAARY